MNSVDNAERPFEKPAVVVGVSLKPAVVVGVMPAVVVGVMPAVVVGVMPTF